MDIKTIFNEFEVVVSDAVFTLREMDVSSALVGSFSTDGSGKMEVDMDKVMTNALVKSIITWKGVNSAESKEPLAVNKENIGKLPFAVKSVLFEELQKRSVLSIDEKKN